MVPDQVEVAAVGDRAIAARAGVQQRERPLEPLAGYGYRSSASLMLGSGRSCSWAPPPRVSPP